jgi:hypothetical protein
MRNNKTLNIVRGGLFTALGLVFMYLAVLLPISSLFFAAVASVIIPICILVSGVRYSFLVYAATALLGIFLPGSKTMIISYILFFGLYGIAKYYIERLRSIPFEILLKMIFFNAALFSSFYIFKLLFLKLPSYKLSAELIFMGLQLIFLLYDYALTVFIYMANKYFNKSA